jgi:hypothetical protein
MSRRRWFPPWRCGHSSHALRKRGGATKPGGGPRRPGAESRVSGSRPVHFAFGSRRSPATPERGRWGVGLGRGWLGSALISAILAGLLGVSAAGRMVEVATVKGRVIQAETGLPLANVLVRLQGDDALGITFRIVTNSEGAFLMEDLPPGDYQLMVSAVDFGLVKRRVRLDALAPLEVEVLLSPGTRLADELTITAEAERTPLELTASDIGKLKSVMMDDAFRALQQLPAVAANDDFNSAFALRGSGFANVGVLFDGIPLHSFFHTIEGIEDTGSTTPLSADLLESLDIVMGGTSAEWSGKSSGFLRLQSRTGSAGRRRALFSVSGSAAMVIGEGPTRSGSWLVSGRKSYVDWIVRKVEPSTELNFGFHDFFAKVVHSAGERHQFSFSLLHGNTGLKDAAEGAGMNSIDRGRLLNDLVHAEWAWRAGLRISGRTHFYLQRADSLNRNRRGEELWSNEQRIVGARGVWDFDLSEKLILTTGLTTEWWFVDNRRNLFDYSTGNWFPFSEFDRAAGRQEAFLGGRLRIRPRVTLAGGWSLSRQEGIVKTYQSPFAGIEVRPSANQLVTVSVGGGGQFPFFNQLYGREGWEGLEPEASRVVEGTWTYGSRTGISLLASAYERRRSHVPWRPEGLWRLVNGEITLPSFEPYRNVLRDRSRGAECRLGYGTPVGLSFWGGYAWGRSRWSEAEGQWFPGNFDQPHGLSLFALYRRGSDVEFSVKWKAASGHPLPAYAELRDGRYYLAEERNRERLPDYRRLDARFGKSFNKNAYRITLFVEVLNLSGRKNYRFSGHDYDSVDPRTGRIRGLVQKQFPFLPTAGVVVEL